MTNKSKKEPLEVLLIDKVRAFVDASFPKEKSRAISAFKNKYRKEITNKPPERIAMHFFIWFLLEHRLSNGMTQMVFALSNKNNFFSKKETEIILNFISSINSLFEVKRVSHNRKRYVVSNVIDNEEYLIKTIDFKGRLKVGDFIFARIVKKFDEGYFFFGEATSYNAKDGLNIKNNFLKKHERKIKSLKQEK